MGKIICEVCGSSNILKQKKLYVCQDCGIKYTLEEVKKLLEEETPEEEYFDENEEWEDFDEEFEDEFDDEDKEVIVKERKKETMVSQGKAYGEVTQIIVDSDIDVIIKKSVTDFSEIALSNIDKKEFEKFNLSIDGHKGETKIKLNAKLKNKTRISSNAAVIIFVKESGNNPLNMIDINTISASVTSEIQVLTANIKTISGEVSLTNGVSLANIKTVSGDVNVVATIYYTNEDDSKIQTTSGDINVDVNTSPNIEIIFETKTISGDIYQSYEQEDAEYSVSWQLTTVSGDININ